MEEVEEDPEGLEEEEDAGHSPLLPPAPSNSPLLRLEEEGGEEGMEEVETASVGVVDVVAVMEDTGGMVEDMLEDTVEDVVEDMVVVDVVLGAVV